MFKRDIVHKKYMSVKFFLHVVQKPGDSFVMQAPFKNILHIIQTECAQKNVACLCVACTARLSAKKKTKGPITSSAQLFLHMYVFFSATI